MISYTKSVAKSYKLLKKECSKIEGPSLAVQEQKGKYHKNRFWERMMYQQRG